jgi:hypothetical protein
MSDMCAGRPALGWQGTNRARLLSYLQPISLAALLVVGQPRSFAAAAETETATATGRPTGAASFHFFLRSKD